MMNFSQKDLERAVANNIISDEQAKALLNYFKQPASEASLSEFSMMSVLQYLGAFIVFFAMTWLASIWMHHLGPFSLAWIALGYGILFSIVGYKLWRTSKYRLLGGLLTTLAVCMVPLFVLGLEKGFGLWPHFPSGSERQLELWKDPVYNQQVHFNHMMVEIATITAAAFTLYFVRFPFLIVPLCFAILHLLIDGFHYLFPSQPMMMQEDQYILLFFGIGVLLASFLMDKRTKEDFSLWGYIIGGLAFWIAITSLMEGSSLWMEALYCLINILLIFLAILLDRKIFLVLGAMGLFGYLSYLAYHVFSDSWLFPIILSLIGLGILYLGFLYQRHHNKLNAALRKYMPKKYLN